MRNRAVADRRRSPWIRALWSAATVLLVLVLTAPLGLAGFCPSGGECVITPTNILAMPVPPWLWAVVTPVVVVAHIAGFLLPRRGRG